MCIGDGMCMYCMVRVLSERHAMEYDLLLCCLSSVVCYVLCDENCVLCFSVISCARARELSACMQRGMVFNDLVKQPKNNKRRRIQKRA